MNKNPLSVPAFGLAVVFTYLVTLLSSSAVPVLAGLRVITGLLVLYYVLGASMWSFLEFLLRVPRKPPALSMGVITRDCLLSFLLSLSVSIALVRAFLLYESLLVAIVALIVVVFCSASIILEHMVPNTGKERILSIGSLGTSWIFPLIVLFASATAFAWFFRAQTPFPSISGWDLNASLASVNWIVSHHGYEYVLVPPYPSALLPYPAIFFHIIASNSLFLGVDIFAAYWYSVYMTILVYMVLVYLLAFWTSRNPYLSLVCALIAFLSGTAFAEVVRTPLFLTLDLVGQLFFLLILVFHRYFDGAGKTTISLIAIAYLGAFSFFTAVVASPFLLYVALGSRTVPLLRTPRQVFRVATILLAVLTPVLIQVGGALSPSFNAYFWPPDGVFPFSLKLRVFGTIYVFFFLALIVLALAFSVSRYTLTKTIGPEYVDMLLYVGAALVIYFSPAYITYRIEFYMRPFMAILVAGLFPLRGN